MREVISKEGNVDKNGWWISNLNWLNSWHQLEEEPGSAEEQPASNKVDAYTEYVRVVYDHSFCLVELFRFAKIG